MTSLNRLILKLLVPPLLVLVFLLPVMSSTESQAPGVSSPSASPTQRQYYQAYGVPNQSLVFQSPPQHPLRRIESWFYPHLGFRLLFDNGYFVKREPIPKVKEHFLGRSLLPTDFNSKLTPEKLKSTFGPPHKTIRFELPRHEMYMYSYTNPLLTGIPTNPAIDKVSKSFTVTFVDNHFIAATIGTDLKLSARKSGGSPR